MKFNPRSYQQPAIDHIVWNEACGLFLDMGMGKTVSTLTAIVELMGLGEVRRTLVIAPKTVAETTWSAEIQKWDHLKHLTYTIVAGNPNKRREALRVSADITLLGVDNLPWLVETLGRGLSAFDMVIFDELTKVKNPAGVRHKYMDVARPLFKRFVGLTGTPSPNGLQDVWGQCRVIDKDIIPLSYRDFDARYFENDDYMGYKRKPVHGADAEIIGMMREKCMSLRAKDFPELNLLEPMFVDVPVILPLKVQKQYEAFEREAALEFLEAEHEQGFVSAVNTAVLKNKLLQFTSGHVYDENRVAVKVHDVKAKRIAEMVEEFQGEPALILVAYNHEREPLLKAIQGAELFDKVTWGQGQSERWDAGQIKALIAHPASMAHGLNMQHGGRFIIWTTPTFNLEHLQQANARLHRQGQEKQVVIYSVVVPGSADEDVARRMNEKEEVQDDLINRLRKKYT